MIEIGKSRLSHPICSAVLYRDLVGGYYVSRNSESFWVNEMILKIGLRIFKGTPEYDRLEALLDDKCITDETIVDWIDKLTIRKASIAQIQVGLSNIAHEAYRQGRIDAKSEIRQALMID